MRRTRRERSRADAAPWMPSKHRQVIMTVVTSFRVAAVGALILLGTRSPLLAHQDTDRWDQRSLEIAATIHDELAGRSFTFSPDSLRRVLCVLREGARGETEMEISRLLGS